MSRTASLESFVHALRSLPPGDPAEADVMRVLESHRVDPAELADQVIWADDHYTRRLVYRDDRFQIILLGWGVGQVTPVHDHAGQRCWMMIESGRLQIADYCWQEGGGAPRLLHADVVGGEPGQIYIDTCACVHEIANPEKWNEPAVSLHVYSRPFSRCGIYCRESGDKEIIDLCYDDYGPFATAEAEHARSVAG